MLKYVNTYFIRYYRWLSTYYLPVILAHYFTTIPHFHYP